MDYSNIDFDCVLVMSEDTWTNVMEEVLIEQASKSENPIQHVQDFHKYFEVVIDNEYQFEYVEIFEREQYEQFIKLESENNERRKDY